MLKSLSIKNYALIETLDIDFQKGLNIITGETGAGKSIILGALGLILGDRSKTDMIRQGAERAMVEAIIEIPITVSIDALKELLGVKNIDKELIIRREVYNNGRSRCFINDSPVSLNIFTELGDMLIDLHGQHEHQALFKIDNHLAYLDNYGTYDQLLEDVKSQYNHYSSCLRQLSKLRDQEDQLKSKQELLAFQVQEIDKVNPQPGEDGRLESEERILRNAEKLHETVQKLENLLYEGEGAVVEKLSMANQHLSQHLQIDERFSKWAEECNSARISVQELFVSIQNFISQIDFNPEHLEDIRERLGSLIQLKKKYGGSLDEVLSFFQNASNELNQIDSLDETIAQIENELEKAREKLSESCQVLSKRREENAGKLSKGIISVLHDLGLTHGEMKIQVLQKEAVDGPIHFNKKQYVASNKGMDNVEFLISLNPGESPKPLRHVASGGEISRIMLAIKTILAETDNIPVLVFDEIDTGISGRIARVVGQNLKNVSQKHQVICITHLPQIASLGDNHFTVEKVVEQGRTKTLMKPLSEQDRIVEIAKLLGGETITETTLQSARELLQ